MCRASSRTRTQAEAGIRRIRTGAPPDAYVTLLGDPPGRALYRRFGFVETGPHSIGMVQRLARPAGGS